jgi:hypothetical protein
MSNFAHSQAPLALLQVEVKVGGGDAVETTHMTFGLIPEVLDAVDVVLLIGEQLGGRCHKEGDVPGVPELAEGRHLFETQGCRGYHKLNRVGGSIGPDLSEEVRVCGLRSGLRNTS